MVEGFVCVKGIQSWFHSFKKEIIPAGQHIHGGFD